MRLWSLHPKFLDRQGLLALWREGLLARKVLSGQTRGYRNHPQLQRFRAIAESTTLLDRYLSAVVAESKVRGYRFDTSKITVLPAERIMRVTTGQLEYEWDHLRRKLAARNPDRERTLPECAEPHPCFTLEPGPIADWERPGHLIPKKFSP